MTNINITINAKNRTIEINKATATAAAKFGTEAYKLLQEARRDNPGYRVVTVAKKTAKPTFKGLTFDYMKKYIEKHDDAEKSIMAEYLFLRGESAEAKDVNADSASYGEIKDWFFETFPEIEKFHKDRETLLKKIEDQRKAKKEQKAA